MGSMRGVECMMKCWMHDTIYVYFQAKLFSASYVAFTCSECTIVNLMLILKPVRLKYQ